MTEGHGLAKRVHEVLGGEEVPSRLDADLGDLAPGMVHLTTGSLGSGFLAPASRLARGHRDRPHRHRGAGRVHQGHAPYAVAAPQPGRPPPAQAGRLRRPRAARCRQVRRDGAAHRRRRHPRVPRARVRRLQARPAGRPALRADRPARPGHPLRRRRAAHAQQDGRLATGTRPRPGPASYVKQIATELIQLYSARMATAGHAFGPDTPWQRELEDAFAYVETPDQLSSIDEVKADMERSVPMDRLICGDVGYGKTEIAVRAAFKAIQDGKQVAVLVPTTLLVQQHLQTFTERYAAVPRRGAGRCPASRATRRRARSSPASPTAASTSSSARTACCPRTSATRTSAWSSSTRSSASASSTRSSSRRCAPPSTSSPCRRPRSRAPSRWRSPASARCRRWPRRPRSGTPSSPTSAPTTRSRSPPRSAASCSARARSSWSTTRSARSSAPRARIRELVPEARVATAHGQMGEHKLEQVVLDFWDKKFDVLVCTTIVETGLDISNANTLIVERADVLGPQPAAPAARPRRTWARAGLLLLPLPAREADDRDGPRPSPDHGQPHRPRRGHPDRDEGPRDPRRGQPARRRAVRPHRRRRLRPLRPPRRRGRGRLPG